MRSRLQETIRKLERNLEEIGKMYPEPIQRYGVGLGALLITMFLFVYLAIYIIWNV